MKRLLLDVDGVIADFLLATETYMLFKHGLKPAAPCVAWDILEMPWIDAATGRQQSATGVKACIFGIWDSAGFCSSIPAYEGAVDQVKQLAEAFDVYFVTSPMVTSKTWVYERSQWLVRHFGPELGKRVVHTHYKELVAGSALIDDKPQHVVDWHYEHGTIETFEGVLNRPYNQGTEGARRYDSLLELLTYA